MLQGKIITQVKIFNPGWISNFPFFLALFMNNWDYETKKIEKQGRLKILTFSLILTCNNMTPLLFLLANFICACLIIYKM